MYKKQVYSQNALDLAKKDYFEYSEILRTGKYRDFKANLDNINNKYDRLIREKSAEITKEAEKPEYIENSEEMKKFLKAKK